MQHFTDELEVTWLALPSVISNDDCFPSEQAFEEMLTCIRDFLTKNPTLGIIFVDSRHFQLPEHFLEHMQDLLTSYHNFRMLSDTTITTPDTILCSLCTLGGFRKGSVEAIVNICNSRFSPQGGYINQNVHKKVGSGNPLFIYRSFC